MSTDTTRTVEVRGSPAKLLKLIALGIIMTAVSLALAIPLIGPLDPFAKLIGYAGVLFFSLCMAVAVVRLFKSRQVVLTLSPCGIRDTRVAGDVIPWHAVTAISTWEYQKQQAMVLAVDPAVEATLHVTRTTRLTRDFNRLLGADGLCVMTAGLDIDYPTLLQMSEDYAKAARSGAFGSGGQPALPAIQTN